ncbi:sulfite exporter TauE/SafE family protein [Nemorincola caseinilytica]|uniref:Sulfite exporter TauE/SafE family protein n=1 Tax=Nemorincola caseinilytica TaxID=2054315 RepID=A0ABP8NIF7_9BACT
MSADTIFIALLMGLTGSLHCAGMCGAIMWAMPFYSFKGGKRMLAFGLYHLLRITAYAVMAMVLFSFRDLFNPGLQRIISIVLGVLLLVAGMISFFPGRILKGVSLPWAGIIERQLSAFVGHPHMGKIAVSGLLNGLLPCGLVYMALSASMSLSSPLQVLSFMYAFGAGTVPILAAIVFLRSRPSLQWPGMRRLAPVVVLFFGCVFVLRGLNLGIPYLSPKLGTVKGELVHSCCHKK